MCLQVLRSTAAYVRRVVKPFVAQEEAARDPIHLHQRRHTVVMLPCGKCSPALHSFNTVGLIMDSLKTNDRLDTAEPELSPSLFHTFFFPFKTSSLHYPKCNYATVVTSLEAFIMQLPLEPQKALNYLFHKQ